MRRVLILRGKKKKIIQQTPNFSPRFSPDAGQNPPWGEGGGDHLPMAGGMLLMLPWTAAVPECGSSSTRASRVAKPSSWALMMPTMLPRTRRGSPGAKGTGAAALGLLSCRKAGCFPVSLLNNLRVQKNLIFWRQRQPEGQRPYPAASTAPKDPAVQAAQCHVGRGCCKRDPMPLAHQCALKPSQKPPLYQAPWSWPQPQAFRCFPGVPGSRTPAATQGARRAPGAAGRPGPLLAERQWERMCPCV